ERAGVHDALSGEEGDALERQGGNAEEDQQHADHEKGSHDGLLTEATGTAAGTAPPPGQGIRNANSVPPRERSPASASFGARSGWGSRRVWRSCRVHTPPSLD